MRCESAPAFGLLLAGMLAAAADAGPAAARPDVYARSRQLRRRQNERECSEDLADILDNAPTTSVPWGATACDYTSTLSGAELSATYASFRSRMSSWYADDLDDITKLEASCTQYASVLSRIRYCYVTGPVPTATAATPTLPTAGTATTTTTGTGTAAGTGPGGIATTTVTTTATPDRDRGMDDGTKAGLAIGVVLAVLLLLFMGYKMFAKYRERRQDATAAAAAAANGNAGPEMGAAAAAAAAAAAKSEPVPELDPSSVSELDPGAAVAVPRTTGVHRRFAELDPAQICELPADDYDPTRGADPPSSSSSPPPPAYVSPVTNSGDRDALHSSAVSPVSPDSGTMRSRDGLGVSTVSEGGTLPPPPPPPPNDDGDAGAAADQSLTVQHGFGRGWLPKER
ncbi:hypothetical protein LX36DRAFT_582546 [Colletotrichum falcatum]|nr:hypothetical protein LX36DRAFT_582546 [Colletotrichum falcatum]